MLENIDPSKSAVAALLSAGAGSWYNYCNSYLLIFTIDHANTAFQHAAWTVAILAGLVSIINGVKTWHKKKKVKR